MAACSIGILPDAEHTPAWPHIRSLLEPAARLTNSPILGEHHQVWVVTDGAEIIAAGTTRLTEEWAEILLTGGRDHRRWARPAMDMICDWARAEGKRAVRLYGRKGWKRVHGLEQIDDRTFERAL